MFDTLFEYVELIIVKNIGDMVGIFSTTIAPLIGACVVLYVVYMAYKALHDPQNQAVMESMHLIFTLAVVTSIAFNTPFYLANVVPAVLGAGDEIAIALIGSAGGTGSLQSMFDTMLSQISLLYGTIDIEILSGATWMHALLVWFQIILINIGFIPFLLVATGYLLVAKIMVSFLLIVGPLFIMMAFFPTTRSFFQAWTGQCFNYTLLSILYPVAFGIFTSILEITIFTANLSMMTCLMTVIIFGALILLSVQIPTLCSTLSGGIGISGLVGAGMAMGGGRALSGGASLASKGATSGGQAILTAISNRGKGKIKAG